VLAALEIVLGAGGLFAPVTAVAAAVAAIYLGFAVFLVSLLARGVAAESCGCAGTTDVPPSWLHVVLDVAGVAAALGFAALRPAPPGLTAVFAAHPLEGAALAAGAAMIAWLASQVALLAPSAFASYRGRASTA
jgi:hypothetical protein